MSTRRTTKQAIIDRALDVRGAELREQAIVRSEVLDTFLALDQEGRARRWRASDTTQKRQLVTIQLLRSTGDWSEADVEMWVAKYDAKWGATLTTTETLVLEACADGAASAEQPASQKRYEAAAAHYRAGHLVEQGATHWRVGSGSGQGVYLVDRASGACTCPDSVFRGWCKHAALVECIEIASELKEV